MKLLHLPRPSRRSGSVLVVTLLIAMVIGITLAAFMDLSGAAHRSVIRSGVWNSCVPLAEAGIEEALTHVYLNSTNLATQGWTLSSSGITMINGVSLTIAKLSSRRLEIMLIPETWRVTNLSRLRAGSRVNLEYDLIGKYLLNQTQRSR